MSDGRRAVGWLAIPAFLITLALIGMALSTESRDEFEERSRLDELSGSQTGEDQSEQGSQSQGDQQADQDFGGSQQDSTQDADQGDGGQEAQDGGTPGGDQSGGRDGEGQRRPVVIRTENGDIVVQLDENGDPVRIVPGDAVVPTDPSRILTPDPDGEFAGFRVTEDGRIEPVQPGEFQPDDFVLRPANGGDGTAGVDIIRPDGTRIQLRPQPDGELTGRQIDGGGSTTDLQSTDGDVVVESGSNLSSDGEQVPGSEPLLIQTDGGPVRIQISEDGDLVADQPSGQAIEVDPEDLSAIRVNEDGSLELVPLDEVSPDDTLLVPTDDGFDLVRPDGSRVEFRPDGENDGVTATEIAADGQEVELAPNPDGSVTLSDGTTVGPIDFAEDGGTFEQLVDRASDLPWPWVFGGIALLALLSIGTAVYLHRNRPDDPFDYSQFVTAGVPEDQFENFLAILLADNDPTRAIRLGFYAAERGLGGLPPRRAEETPFEWHARVEQRRPLLAKPLGPVCDMFARARFGSVPPTLQDRDLMVEHLRELNRVANAEAAGRDMAGV